MQVSTFLQLIQGLSRAGRAQSMVLDSLIAVIEQLFDLQAVDYSCCSQC